jgi:hypothetical protein
MHVLYLNSCIRLFGGCVSTSRGTLTLEYYLSFQLSVLLSPVFLGFPDYFFPLSFVASVIRPRNKLTLNEFVWNPNWNCSVGTVSNLRSAILLAGARDSSFLEIGQTDFWSHPAYCWVPRVISPWVKRPGRAVGYLVPSSVKVSTAWSYNAASCPRMCLWPHA